MATRRGGLEWSAIALVATSWLSAACFAVYILAFYIGAVPAGAMLRWNTTLPGLYDPSHGAAQATIGAHFVAGATVLLLGPIQFVARIRASTPAVHRWIGRVYVAMCALAGLGGLGFIATQGTVGGAVMNVGFGIYGALMVIAAIATYATARRRIDDRHCAWAMRLFALAIGSWLYRMDYGFWFIATHNAGHTDHFRGWFDAIMAFAFYVPNLAIAELVIRAPELGRIARVVATAAIVIATLVIAFGSVFFVRYWLGATLAVI
jgi:Predicted membrane protein (DUF2306)